MMNSMTIIIVSNLLVTVTVSWKLYDKSSSQSNNVTTIVGTFAVNTKKIIVKLKIFDLEHYCSD